MHTWALLLLAALVAMHMCTATRAHVLAEAEAQRPPVLAGTAAAVFDLVQRKLPAARSLEVPAAAHGSVDIALVCDVYHHFEYPKSTMTSLKAALKTDGPSRVVLVDFHRDASKMVTHAPSWALEHIRADQATFRDEILACGYELLEEPELPALTEKRAPPCAEPPRAL